MTSGVHGRAPLLTRRPTRVSAASANRAGLPAGSSRAATRRALSVIDRAVRTASRSRSGVSDFGFSDDAGARLDHAARDLGLVAAERHHDGGYAGRGSLGDDAHAAVADDRGRVGEHVAVRHEPLDPHVVRGGRSASS